MLQRDVSSSAFKDEITPGFCSGMGKGHTFVGGQLALLRNVSAEVLGDDGGVEAKVLKLLQARRGNGYVEALMVALAAQRDKIEALDQVLNLVVLVLRGVNVEDLVAVVRHLGRRELKAEAQS